MLLPFPFSDLTSAKKRPVLMLTDADAHGDFISCPITSRGGWQHSRPVTTHDMVDGAMPLASWVRTDRVITLNIGLIVRRFGRLTAEFRLAIADDVCRMVHASKVT